MAKTNPKIVVLDAATLCFDRSEWDIFRQLGEVALHDRTPSETEAIVTRASSADIVLTNKVPLRAETLARLPALRFIGVLATGYNVIDIKAAREGNVPVANVPVYGTETVAQHTMALLLELCNQVGLHDRSVKNGGWVRSADFSYWEKPVIELSGRTLGLVGFGRIGRMVGQIGHAFGMTIWAADTRQQDPPDYKPFAWKSVPEVFAGADVVTLHCPQTKDNLEFINTALLKTMKPSAFLINTARGMLINEADLARALGAGAIAGAALDVISHEPMLADNPLLKSANCLITPHMAWTSESARRKLLRETAENVRGFLTGVPRNVVN
jgi:glycerate dehydrogenase